jgi:hypothetical protein
MALSGEDISKIDKAVEEPLEKCLLYLAYKADKIQLEDLMHKESIRKMA